MPQRGTIHDIRYYESKFPNINGQPLPCGFGDIYMFPKSLHAIGQRIARKLQEMGFISGQRHHVYFNLTPLLPHEKASLSDREVDKNIQFVDYGTDPNLFNMMSEAEQENFIISSTFHGLHLLSTNQQQSELLDSVKSLIEESGDELEIVFKTKETTRYRVTISFQIQPVGMDSTALIEYYDKESKGYRKQKLTRLEFYEDIHALIGSIFLLGDTIEIKPLTSSKAQMDIERYDTPIAISIGDLFTNKRNYVTDVLKNAR